MWSLVLCTSLELMQILAKIPMLICAEIIDFCWCINANQISANVNSHARWLADAVIMLMSMLGPPYLIDRWGRARKEKGRRYCVAGMLRATMWRQTAIYCGWNFAQISLATLQVSTHVTNMVRLWLAATLALSNLIGLLAFLVVSDWLPSIIAWSTIGNLVFVHDYCFRFCMLFAFSFEVIQRFSRISCF